MRRIMCVRRSDLCRYLGPADRTELSGLVTYRDTPRRLVKRVGIVPATADGHQIAQSLPILQEVNSQHCLRWNWRPSALRPNLRIARRDQCLQPSPRNHSTHLCQKLLAQRDFFLHRVTKSANGGLFWASAGLLPSMPAAY